jgi:hypothetical protein
MEFTKGPENATDVWTPEELGRDTFEPGESLQLRQLAQYLDQQLTPNRNCPHESFSRPREVSNGASISGLRISERNAIPTPRHR